MFYYANETVLITASVDNASSVNDSGFVQLAIRVTGETVNIVELPVIPTNELAAGAQFTLPSEWNVGTILSGAYELVGQLINQEL